MMAENIARQKFLEEYRHIRHAEGRGSDTSEYYRALPFCAKSDPNAAMWAMRSQTYSYFVKNILRPLEVAHGRALDVLDLGAGNCWLSNRLAERGHRPVAVDIFNDDRDGLRAARHYSKSFRVVESDFETLPLSSKSFDLAIFNASLHYSIDYVQTLREAKRCLRTLSPFVVLDTPLYRQRDHGKRMVEERHNAFLQRYGFRSDALPSLNFLDTEMLHTLQRTLRIDWRIWKPWYGLAWHTRPVKAFVARRRPPSKFWILVGTFQSL